MEKVLKAEMTEHLGYEKHSATGDGSDNSNSSKAEKTIKGAFASRILTL